MVRVETEDKQLLCVAEVADSHWTRFWGLMGRKSLPKGGGLWISPCNSVQTTFMRFPLDLVYLTRDNGVAKTFSRVKPWRLSFGGPEAHSVLELPPGTFDACPLRVGQKLLIKPPEIRPSDALAPPGPPSTGDAAL